MNNYRYTIVQTDGSIEQREQDEPMSLAELQELVGGLIQAVPPVMSTYLRVRYFPWLRRRTVWVDEEGLLKDDPKANFFCSSLCGHALVGTVVIEECYIEERDYE